MNACMIGVAGTASIESWHAAGAGDGNAAPNAFPPVPAGTLPGAPGRLVHGVGARGTSHPRRHLARGPAKTSHAATAWETKKTLLFDANAVSLFVTTF